MASLRVLKGGTPGQVLALDKPRIVLGREAKDCDYVIPNQAVSRVHAEIRLVGGLHVIEDLKSRNKTYVNNKLVDTPTALNDQDRIKICDFLATYHADTAEKAPLPEHMRPAAKEDDGEDASSTVQHTIGRMPQQQLLELQPADALRALLEVATTLSQSLSINDLLEKIADTLLATFRQADRCFVIIREEATGQLTLPVSPKTRRPQTGDSPRFSRTIVKNCLDSLQAFLSEDAASDSKFSLAQSITDFRILSVMCAPLASGDKGVGVIQLDSQDRSKKFTQDDLKLLMGVANQASAALELARLHEEAVHRERIQRDLELGESVQRAFLPQRLPEVPGYQFYAQYKSALTIGGDYYDFIPLPDGKLAVLLGDVAGKGVPAALLMAKLSAEARACMLAAGGDSVKGIATLNDVLVQLFLGGAMDRFVTFAAAVLDPVENVVTILNAGHMPPLLFCPASGTLVDAIEADLCGPPLGLIEGCQYAPARIALGPSDSLLLYTDGVTDATNALNQPFAMKGIRDAILDESPLAASGPPRPDVVGQRLVEAVRRHSAGRPQNDDIAVVCFGRLDPTASGPALGGRSSSQ
jgi:serine phosphatase RsbU (regulator of sigma subunit)/pSer/pThr/pTyr-binding forkhead associated (FHA) protein